MVLDFCKIALEGSPTKEYEDDAEILLKAIKIIDRDCTQEVKDKILEKLRHIRELKLSFVHGFEKGYDYKKEDLGVKQ